MLFAHVGSCCACGVRLGGRQGGFIYVATVDVLPPLLAQPSSAFQTAMQMLAMCTGVAMMVIVIAFE